MKTKTITPNTPADFEPDRQPQIPLRPFRFWCQKVLPTVYDDSLSYVELLYKVIDFLNKTMEDVSNMDIDMTNLYNAFKQLQEYVNNYFDSLDVQQEINNKLDEMVEDGTLDEIINQHIFSNKKDKSQQTIYVYQDSDITSIINSLEDNTTVVIQKGNYTVDSCEIEKNNIELLGEFGVIISSNQETAIKITGNNTIIKNITFNNTNEVKHPEHSTPVFGFIELDGDNFIIDNCIFNNITKAFVYTHGFGEVKNSVFNGEMSGSEYPIVSANNNLFGLYLSNFEDSPQTEPYIVKNCSFNDLIEGVYFGDYNYGISTESCIISSCEFKNMYDHAIYINGGDNAYIDSNICVNCNAPFATYCDTVSILNNTQNGTLKNQYNYYQGILSIRSPKKCLILNNNFTAESVSGSVFINITNLHNGDIGLINISNNIIYTEGESDIIRIGSSSYTSIIDTVVIANNTIYGSSQYSVIPINADISNLICNGNSFIITKTINVIAPYKTVSNCNISDNIYSYIGEQPLTTVNVYFMNGNISNGVFNNNYMITKANVTSYIYFGDSNVTLYSNVLNNGIVTSSAGSQCMLNKCYNVMQYGEITVSGVAPTTITNSNINQNTSVILFAKDSTGYSVVSGGYFFTYNSPGNGTITFNTPSSGVVLKYVLI